MQIIDIQQNYENKIDQIWADGLKTSDPKYPLYKDILRKSYAIEKYVEKEAVLYIGMNPSFTEGKWNNGTKAGCKAFYEVDVSCNNTNTYFKMLDDLHKSIGTSVPMSHHDLLFMRHTKQANIKTWKEEQDFKCFFDRQLEISKEIMTKSAPRLIVVLNAYASTLVEKMLNKEEVRFNSDIGANICNISGKETPILFSGMLSGQHALDNGSKKTLAWHIGYILKNW